MQRATKDTVSSMEQGHNADRSVFNSAYSKFSLLLLVIILITLLPHYGKILAPDVAVSTQMILHGALFLGWFMLFVVQASLIASRRIAIHKTLGYSSIVLAIALVISGTGLLLEAMRGFDPNWHPLYLYSRISLIWGIYHTLASFIIFYTLALIFRRNAQTHKRLMLMSCLCMISASITRVAYLPQVPFDGTAVTLLSTYVLLITPMVIDRVQQNKVHPVFTWGVPVYVITQIVFIAILPPSGIGRVLAFPF